MSFRGWKWVKTSRSASPPQSMQQHPRGLSMLMTTTSTKGNHTHTITALPQGNSNHMFLIVPHCHLVKRTSTVVQPLLFPEFAQLKVALDNLLPANATERFKFQILTDHLKLEEALLIADSYSNSRYPYSHTKQALTELYGQPHQLALQRIAGLMDGPNIRSGDTKAFRLFALKIRALVGMLEQLGGHGRTELTCGSHVSRLLAKLPHDLQANFKRYVNPLKTPTPTLLDLAEWMEYEVRVQEDGTQFNTDSSGGRMSSHREQRRELKVSHKPTAIFHGSEQRQALNAESVQQSSVSEVRSQEKLKKYCPFCNTISTSVQTLNCWLKSRLWSGSDQIRDAGNVDVIIKWVSVLLKQNARMSEETPRIPAWGQQWKECLFYQSNRRDLSVYQQYSRKSVRRSSNRQQ